MRRKIARTLIILVGIVILASVSLAWYGIRHPRQQSTPPRRPGEEYGLQYREPGEIVIEDLGATKRVTDRRQGYSVEVPKEWFVEEPDTVTHGLSFYTEDRGCKVTVDYLLTEKTPDDLIRQLEQRDLPELSVLRYEVTDTVIKGLPAKWVILESVENGYSEAVYVAGAKKILEATLFVSGNERENCRERFTEMLRSTQLF